MYNILDLKYIHHERGQINTSQSQRTKIVCFDYLSNNIFNIIYFIKLVLYNITIIFFCCFFFFFFFFCDIKIFSVKVDNDTIKN